MASSLISARVAIHTLEHLSLSMSRAAARNPQMSFTSLVPQQSGTYALGGLGIKTNGASRPAPLAPGSSIRMEIRDGTSRAASAIIHPAVAFGFENPSVRFGDRTKTNSRPKSAEGAISFHFSHSYQSKTSPILQLIREFHGGRKYSGSQAGDHLLYIEREGAAETIEKTKDPNAYDEFEDENEFEIAEKASQGRDAISQQDYLERLGAVERVHLKNLSDHELEGLHKASFGTIGDTLQERHHFWSAVEKFEREPRGDAVTLRFKDRNNWWKQAIAHHEKAPKALRDKLREKFTAASEPEDIVLSKLPTKAAFEIYKWAQSLDDDALIEVEPGRGGRVQNRIIAELPWELDAIDRVKIVDDFTKILKDGQGNPLPFWAVIHAPDQNNDRRNYHVHIIYYDRPVAKMLDPKNPSAGSKWDFEITEEKVYKNYTRNINHPYAQEKFREASEKEWIPLLRTRWEEVSNKVMEEVGLDKRYDRRTYKEMGIAIDPLKHIPSKTFNKERKGELTDEGVALARRQWDNVRDSVIEINAKRMAARRQKVEKKVKRAEAALAKENPFKEIAAKEINRLGTLAHRLARRVGIAELYQDLGRVVIDRTASRARLVFHAAIDENGKKKRGRPPKNPGAQALNGATKPLGKDASEARDFLLVLLERGKSLDKKNQMELLSAHSHLHTVLKRIDFLYANPKQHPLDTRQPGYLDLNLYEVDSAEHATKKAEMIDRVQESLNMYMETVALPAMMEKARQEEAKDRVGADRKEHSPAAQSDGSDKTPAVLPSASPPEPSPVAPSPKIDDQKPPKPEFGRLATFRFDPFPKPEPRNKAPKSTTPSQASPVSAPAPLAPAAKPPSAQPGPVAPNAPSPAPARTVPTDRPPSTSAAPSDRPAAPEKPTPVTPSSGVAKPQGVSPSTSAVRQQSPKPAEPQAVKPAQAATVDVQPKAEPAPQAPAAPASTPQRPEVKASSEKPAVSKAAAADNPKSAQVPNAPRGSVRVPTLPESATWREITERLVIKPSAPATTGTRDQNSNQGIPSSKPDGITIPPFSAPDTADKKKSEAKDTTPAQKLGQPPLPETYPLLPQTPKKPKKPKQGTRRPDNGPER